MIRAIGAIAVLSAGLLLFLQGERMRTSELKTAEELLTALRRLESDVRACHAELLREFSALGGFFGDVAEKQKEQRELPLSWVLEERAMHLPEEERAILCRFGKSLALDEASILSATILAEKELEALIDRRRCSAVEQRRISAALSFSGAGLLLLVLL